MKGLSKKEEKKIMDMNNSAVIAGERREWDGGKGIEEGIDRINGDGWKLK